ncbi:LamG-like jellyroll fold domain-containing protein [Aeoliella mucimassa]|uniref:Laminin G domain protein n=1 Tax=Aeoliella mucimassa TaxID=2527972 RepID=A0A518AMS6_9BACT|nr:LamG-like jellyroll fold domain-containing protein [Aeoliella mucimassa]QDU56029.1 Laminin G domain protein [Aeoliella mucimassa]
MTKRPLWVIAFTFSSILFAQTTQAVLVAHWPLDDIAGSGTALDQSGNSYDGSIEGGVTQGVTDGVMGDVMQLDGVDGRVALSDHVSQLNELTSGTITGWFNHGNTSIGAIFTLSNSTVGSTEARLFIENNRLRYDVRDESGNPTGEAGFVASQEGVDDGNWHHFAVSVDSVTELTNIYLDGVHVGQSYEPLWGSLTDAALALDTMAVGSNTDSSGNQWFYNGLLSNIALYDDVLSHGQVLDVMQNGVTASPASLPAPGIRTSGILADYKFNESQPGTGLVSGDLLVDETGNHNGFVLSDTLSYTSGLDAGDSALSFSDDSESSHRLSIANDSDLYILPGESFTVESVFRTSQVGSTMGLVSKNDTGGGEMWFRIEGDGDVRFFLDDHATTTAAVRSDSTLLGQEITDGDWHHVAGVYDALAGELRLYVDHQLVDMVAAPNAWGSPIMGGTADLTIGDFIGVSNRKFVGDMDQVRISLGALNPDDFVAIVPEPATITTTLLALAMAGFWARRR